MAVGIFNPKDTSRTTASRPAHTMLAEGVRKWMSDVLKTQPKSQDWNAIIANFRAVADAYVIADEETNTDNILRDGILSAVNDLTTGAVVTLASAATTNLGTTRNSRIDISGSVSITGFGTTPNKIRIVRTTGAPLITLPNGQSYQASAGDAFLTASDNAGAWRILAYWPAGDQLFGLARPTLASAATVDIGAQQAFAIEISGSNAISSLGSAANRVKILRMAAAASFTHGVNLVVPGAINFTAAAGDHILAVSNAAGVWSIFPLLGGEKAISISIRRAADAEAVRALLGFTPIAAMSPLPAVEGTTVAGVATYTTQLARWNQIGNRVFFSMRLVWSAHTGTGNMKIVGLPLPAAVGSGHTAVEVQADNTATMISGFISAGSSEISLRIAESPGSTAPPIDPVATLRISGNYEV